MDGPPPELREEPEPPTMPFNEWHDELKAIGTIAHRLASKPKPNFAEARARLDVLRQRTREHAADSVSPVARVGDAVLLETAAVIEKLEGRHLHEATRYEHAAAIWLAVEADRHRVNEPTLGDGIYKALVCTTLACAALVADAGKHGDPTMSLEAALRDAAIADEMERNAARNAAAAGSGGGSFSGAPSTVSSPAASPPRPEPGDPDAKLGDKAKSFFAGLKTRLQQKATDAKTKANEMRESVSSAASPLRTKFGKSAGSGSFPSSAHPITVGPDGRPLLPRHAKPHNFRHSTRVHGLLTRLADHLAVLSCLEVASDLYELSATFLVDEVAKASQAQQDYETAVSRGVPGAASPQRGVLGSNPPSQANLLADAPPQQNNNGSITSGNLEREPSDLPNQRSFVAASQLSLGRLGGNAALFGGNMTTAPATAAASDETLSTASPPRHHEAPGLLPPCRVPLKNVSRYLTSIRKAVTLRLALQQYTRADETASEALVLLEPLLAYHRAALRANPSLPAIVAARHLPPAEARQAAVPRACRSARGAVHGPSGRLWYSGSLHVAMPANSNEVPSAAARESLPAAPQHFFRTTGARSAMHLIVRPGGSVVPVHPTPFGEAECGELRLIALSRIIAAFVMKEAPAIIRNSIAAFENLPSNLVRASAALSVATGAAGEMDDETPPSALATSPDVSDRSELPAALVLNARARTIAATARFCVHCAERYETEDAAALPETAYLGAMVPGGPMVLSCALDEAVAALAVAASVPPDPFLTLTLGALSDTVTFDPLPRYLSRDAPKPLASDSPSPQRAPGRRHIDPADLP
jgi:hypothetical protein